MKGGEREREELVEGLMRSRTLFEPCPEDTWIVFCTTSVEIPNIEGKTIFLTPAPLLRYVRDEVKEFSAVSMLDNTRANVKDKQCRLLVEGVRDYAMILLDVEGRITAWNAGAERILGWSEAEMLGRNADLIFTPEDRTAGEPSAEIARANEQDHAMDLRWHVTKDGSRFWADSILEALRGEDGTLIGFAKILRDATAQKREAEQLRETVGRLETVLESLTDAFFSLDRDWRITYVNAEAEQFLSRTRREILGRGFWEVFPEAVGSTFERQYRRAVAEQTPISFEEFYTPLDTWFEVCTYPSVEGLSIYFRDVNKRKKLEAEQSRLSDANRLLLESMSEGIYGIDVAGHLTFVNQAGALMLGFAHEEMLGRDGHSLLHHTRPDGRPYPAEDCPIYQVLQTGGDIRVEDDVFWRKDGTAFPVSFSAAPIVEAGVVTGAVVTFDDIAGRKALETERERLLAVTQARAEREALVNRIGSAIRTTTDPECIQQEASRLLGEALGVDHCYFSAYDHEGNTVRIGWDWHRAGLPSVSGEYSLSDCQQYMDTLYAQGTAVIPDAEDPDLPPIVARTLARFGLRAFLAVPLLDGGRYVAAAVAAMSDRPRIWTPDEVSLMEAVLTQTRTAAETARVRQRERNIAGQLQSALQPPLPGVVRGLDLAKYYEAALDEAGVGGDFYDVFPIEKGCTALVVGDLSGKGLAAAAQVSTVRNMLRAFLYSKSTLGEAVSELNRIIAQNNLLSGFATLFVGCYDSGMQTLAYVNCGQEPGLIRRAATGAVEELGPTGAILGMAEDSRFEEKTVALLPGDAFALFTDGLTEAGPNRRELLGVEGVTALLAGSWTAGENAETLTIRLIEVVDAYARGGVRDDVCLLVGVA